jgi:hypothetical protein
MEGGATSVQLQQPAVYQLEEHVQQLVHQHPLGRLPHS